MGLFTFAVHGCSTERNLNQPYSLEAIIHKPEKQIVNSANLYTLYELFKASTYSTKDTGAA